MSDLKSSLSKEGFHSCVAQGTSTKWKSSPVRQNFRTTEITKKTVNKCLRCENTYSVNSSNGILIAYCRKHGYLLQKSGLVFSKSVFTHNGLHYENNSELPRESRNTTITERNIGLHIPMAAPSYGSGYTIF